MHLKTYIFIGLLLVKCCWTFDEQEDELKDFAFTPKFDAIPNKDRVRVQGTLAAQASRKVAGVAKPPATIAKPPGVTNSHRPQYNIESLEESSSESRVGLEPLDRIDDLSVDATDNDFFDEPDFDEFDEPEDDVRPINSFRAKEVMIREAVVKALERKDHIRKFAQILPIIRAMTPTQRLTLASLVANQVTTPPGKQGLNLDQVRSMFGSSPNATSDLMLPILLDMANLFRRAARGRLPPAYADPRARMLRRSFRDDLDQEPFRTDLEDEATASTTTTTTMTTTTTTAKPQVKIRSHLRLPSAARNGTKARVPALYRDRQNVNRTPGSWNKTKGVQEDDVVQMSTSLPELLPTPVPEAAVALAGSAADVFSVNSTLELARASNASAESDPAPVAEKLRALNRYIDRKGNLVTARRPAWLPPRRPAAVPPEVLTAAQRRRVPACDLFTNSLCLHVDDYPTEAILTTMRRNKAAAGLLLADITAADAAEDNLNSKNRRGDSAGNALGSGAESGFMCPSSVKYARPQRARATSGSWKYIVNTGEHTQTLRLEKCLRPKESCTYLTDNFKSRCVQVYNYHRLLTWDQQNGLHMDIFKVPTCCSCHIEGYSVSFPPLGHRTHEKSPIENIQSDLPDSLTNPYEHVQQVTHSPTHSNTHSLRPFSPSIDNYQLYNDNSQNSIPDTNYQNPGYMDDDIPSAPISNAHPEDSYSQSYFPDNYKVASEIRNIKKPAVIRSPLSSIGSFETSATLPSYLEPPTPSAIPIAPTFFGKTSDPPSKHKTFNYNPSKRGKRPVRRPLRKKTTEVLTDLVPSGSSPIDSASLVNNGESYDEINNEPIDLNDFGIPSHQQKNNIYISSTRYPASSTTEKYLSTQISSDQGMTVLKDMTLNKRVNYNYHPIIDFFEPGPKDAGTEAMDRADSVSTYTPSVESEWKPMSFRQTSKVNKRNVQSS